jgi:hypothetical protein
VKGKRKNKDRQRMAGDVMLEADYFANNPTHPLSFGGAFG